MTTNASMAGAGNVQRTASLRFLNATIAAEDFMTRAAINSGARSLLADPEKLDDGEASAAALNAATALRDGAATVERLARDESRTLPQRNEAGAKLAAEVAATIDKAGEAIERRATALFEAGKADAARVFAPDLSRQAYDAEIVRWIREESAKENGVIKVHEMARTNVRVASVIINAEPFLLGLHETVYARMRDDAIETHAPEAWAKMLRSTALWSCPVSVDRLAS